ncbi:hypothetical protein GOB93_10605 [Acetobacter musti]|uniref:Lipoprotein n=1 Tax=Acetobacter musti TaxID=864732 RepID=A0ABX0JNT5_9PROT|nr:hypothetical protein [Acetobacter musti]NHN85088.1 hypothetical protein [Acetobacter musti]
MRRVRNRFSTVASLSRVALLMLGTAGALAACSSDDTVTSFPPYQYSYLSKLQLNVATVQVLDHAAPGTIPGDESGQAPIPPDQALVQVAQDRLVAAGQSGAAVFTVDRASILHQPDGTLSGQMDAHLDISSSTGQQLGVAEAHVTREFKPDLSKGDADSRANLYEMTRQMMQDMNVELEFQIRKNLKDWLVDAGGMPAAGAIETQSLGGPGSSPSSSPADTQTGTGSSVSTGSTAGTDPGSAAPAQVDTTRAPASAVPASATDDTGQAGTASTPAPTSATTPTEPDAIFPSGAPSDDSAGTTPQKRSPAAGYLHLPSSTPATTATPSTTTPSASTTGY